MVTTVYLGNIKGPAGVEGKRGAQGLPGPNATPADEAVAAYIGTTGSSATKAALQKDFALAGEVDVRRFYDVQAPPESFDAVFAAAVAAASAGVAVGAQPLPVRLPAGHSYPGEFTVTDQSLTVVGGGTLVQRPGRGVIRATATPGRSRPLTTAITALNVTNTSSASSDAPQMSTYRTFGLGPTDMLDLVYGDQLLIQSNDAHGVYVTGSTRPTYAAGWVHVDGFALTIQPTTSIPQDVTLTGASSGATGYVVASNVNGSGRHVLMFHSITGTFAANETVLVNNVAVGTVFLGAQIFTADDLNDIEYKTSAKVRLVNRRVRVNLDVRIDTDGDPHRPLGAAARKNAIELRGIYDPQIRAHFDGGYNRGVSLVTCRGGRVDVTGGNLPNNPSTTEGAFGYLTEAMAATEGVEWRINGSDVRHGFTTNTYPQDGQPSDALESLLSGCPKDNIVTGVTRNTIGAGFDTHGGAIRTWFRNCMSSFTGSGGQDATRDVGFNNRAFATIFENCTSYGAAVGFLDSAYTFEAPFDNTIQYRSIAVYNYLHHGFRHGSNLNGAATTKGTTKYVFGDVYAEAKIIVLDAIYRQTAMDLSTSYITVGKLTSKNRNFADVYLRGAAQSVTLTEIVSDQSENVAAAVGAGFVVSFGAALRFARNLLVGRITLIENREGTSTRSIYHAASGVAAKVRRPATATGNTIVLDPTNTVHPLTVGPGTIATSDAMIL